jgi:DNA-binding beta-propeller fold protein YncE
VRMRSAAASIAAAGALLVPAWSTPALAAGGGSGVTPVWAARDAGPGGVEDRFGGMVLSPDGSTVYVARSSGGVVVVVARDTATGERRWVANTPGPDGAPVFDLELAAAPDASRVFITGEAERTVDTRSPVTVAYDATDGTVLWSATPTVPDQVEVIPRRIAVARDGERVFVTGSRTGTFDQDDFWNYWTVAYSAATGARLWRSIYAGNAHGADTAEGLAVGPGGTHVFVTGTSEASGSDRDIATVAYRATDGSRLWVARYEREADDAAVDVSSSRDGSRVYVAGSGRPTLHDDHGFRLLSYVASSGSRTGVAEFTDGGNDFASGLALSPDGSRAFVVGSGNQDFLTVAFDTSAMAPAWNAHYDGGHGDDAAGAVAVSPHGTRVDVTGESREGGAGCSEIPSTAFATVEYKVATGQQRWVARYAGRGRAPDQAGAVAVTPDGSLVLVAGDSDSECRNSDLATLAYPVP